MADIGWNTAQSGAPAWYCRACGATGTGDCDAPQNDADGHACPPEVGCDCPHLSFCDVNDCTQCCRFDVMPDPADCHDPRDPFPLEPNETARRWEDMRPCERQLGGYWLYAPKRGVDGGGKAWIAMARPTSATVAADLRQR